MSAAFFFLSVRIPGLQNVWGFMCQVWPVPDPFLFHPLYTPEQYAYVVSCYCLVQQFLNISTPVTTTLRSSSVIPTISTSSDTLIVPRSTLPVATVPAGYREHVLNGHQERFVGFSRSGDIAVYCFHQLVNAGTMLAVFIAAAAF